MLIPMSELTRRHGIDVRGQGVLHCGAHTGEEAAAYALAGATPVFWIEGNPDLIPALATNVRPYKHEVICALLSDTDGAELVFNVANNGQSSSVLPFGTHAVVSPDVHYTGTKTLPSRTLDSLHEEHDFSRCTFLNCDLQGYEGVVLRGAEKVLSFMDTLYLEVNRDELYKGCVRLPEMTRWLADRGFEMIDLSMAGNAGWGDGVFRRKT